MFVMRSFYKGILRNTFKPVFHRSFCIISSEEEFDSIFASKSKEKLQFDFNSKSKHYLDRLEAGFTEYDNKDVKFSREDGQFTVEVKKIGLYRVSVDAENSLIELLSPVSGVFEYKYNPTEGYWKSVKDGHVLEDLLIREFIHHSVGLLHI